MARFYPKGFIGSEEAILKIAKTRDPERWGDDAMSSDERQVWNALGKSLNATFIYNHLPYHVKEADRAEGTIDRYCDFMEALSELRKSLFAGETVAYFCEDSGKMKHVLKEGWGGDEGDDILLKGTVTLEGGLWDRVILLKASDIEFLARSLPPAWSSGGKVELAERITGAGANDKKRQIYKAYRDALDDVIPTIVDDVAAMKSHGISRQDTRWLRKQFPSRPRGRPKMSG
ncbi:hypothetical protein ABIB06_004910 [Bradyrhizobium sp. LB8.2]|uniref:hypothetical protein n=1 Tax=Bradyrhizobium sp. LB8.2 TaxID=3156330 RepID=UPI0033927A08